MKKVNEICVLSDLKVGQTVYILSLKKEGTIYAISNNTIKVQIGIIFNSDNKYTQKLLIGSNISPFNSF